MKLRFLFLLIVTLTVAGLPARAQNLVEVDRIRLGYGRGSGQIGLDRGGGEHWKPLFFAVDGQGRLHLPDFYKARIAVFDAQGRLVREAPCPEGISPRLNYFSLTPAGNYITIGDYHLYHLSSGGKLLWKRELGYGLIPQQVLVNRVGIFLAFPAGDGRSLVFDYHHERPLGRFGLADGGRGIPMIATPGKGRFTFRLGAMKKLPGFKPGTFGAEEEAHLLYVDREKRSLWKQRKQGLEVFLLYSEEGELLGRASLSLPAGLPGSGFWTVIDEGMRIYKNVFYQDYMEIVIYRFPDLS